MTIRAIELAIEETAIECGLLPENIRARDRHRTIARARQVAFYVARLHGLSLPEIGIGFGRDHTTVLHGIRCVALSDELVALAARINCSVVRQLESFAVAT